MRRILVGTIAVTFAALCLTDVAAAHPAAKHASAREECDPTTTAPVLGGTVPTPEDVLGFRQA